MLFSRTFSSSTEGGPLWPAADNLWNPVLFGGSLYGDAQADGGDYYATKPANPMDIVGGLDPQGEGPFAAGFWSLGPTDLMFRLRVDGDPSQDPQFVWMALLNTDADADVDCVLQLDMAQDQQVELVAAVAGGPANGWEVILANPPHLLRYDATVYARFSNASRPPDPPFTGSHFHGPGPMDDDYFVDIAIPLLDFMVATGWNPGEPLAIAFSTSAPHLTDNQDRPDYPGWDVPTVPAPDAPVPALLGVVTTERLYAFKAL